jgi:ribose 5-phosphate isomerase B
LVDPVHGGLVDGKKMDPEAPCWFQSICEEDLYKVCGEVTKILLFSYLRRIIEFLSMKIGICNDHAGVEYKFKLMKMLQKRGIEVVNFGTDTEESVDYPDFAHALAQAVENGKVELGIALCGTGNGMAMSLNKHQGIRAGLAWGTAIGHLVAQHNNANVLVLPARFISYRIASAIVREWLDTPFEGGRHQGRIDKIPCR